MSAFGKPQLDQFPIGSVIQSPINLEAMTNGQWIALDGRDCNRSDYPLLSPYFPAGVFTSTVRTLDKAPQTVNIAASATHLVVPSVANTNEPCLQYSTDGASWITQASWQATAANVTSVIYAGSRFVAVCSATVMPRVFTDPSAALTATTGSVATTSSLHGLAYGPTANGGAGRTVCVKDGALATASAIFYMNDGSTAWSAASGGSSCNRVAVCWTGQKFIAVVSAGTDAQVMVQTSSDGAAWSDQFLPFQASGVSNSIASDGNGTVVIPIVIKIDGNTVGGVITSKDHGATWRFIKGPQDGYWLRPDRVFYLNGKFIGITSGSAYPLQTFSSDGIGWTVDAMFLRGMGNVSYYGISALAIKGGVYYGVGTQNTGYSATEDMSKFKLRTDVNYGSPTGGVNITFQQYMKVRN